MQFTQYLAQFLRDNGYEGTTSGFMPSTPDRIATVYASELRPNMDTNGSRVQIIVRSSPRKDDALEWAVNIAELLDGFKGALTIDSPYVHDMQLESGISDIGEDQDARISYSMNFRAWYC